MQRGIVAPPPRSSKIGMTELGSRTNAKPDAASVNVSQMRPQAFTYFTTPPKSGQQYAILYDADRMWAEVTLTLETAGPVAVGFSTNLVPVLGGSGRLLRTGQDTKLTVPQGATLYIAATAINRVSVIIQPYPFLEQMLAHLEFARKR